MSRDNFIEQSKQIYGNKYDYKNVPDIELYPFNNIPIFALNMDYFFNLYMTIY